jgi:hypothetical protein
MRYVAVAVLSVASSKSPRTVDSVAGCMAWR